MQPIELHDYVTQTKAAELLGVCRMTIWQWMKEGKIQPVLVCGIRMIPQSEVERINHEKNS